MSNLGFTKIEMLVTTAVLSVLTTMAVGGFYWYIPKAQVMDANGLISKNQFDLVKSMQKGACTADGNPINIVGKYGTLNVSGTFAPRSGSQCLSGCKLTYTFNVDGVRKELAGKTIALDAIHDMKLIHSASSTVPEKYNPFANRSAYTLGENCATVGFQVPIQTNGGVSGNDVGDAAPGGTAPPPPDPPTPPVTPPGGTTTPPPDPPTPQAPVLPPGATESGNTITTGTNPNIPCSQGGYCDNCWFRESIVHPNITLQWSRSWRDNLRDWPGAYNQGIEYKITNLVSPIVAHNFANVDPIYSQYRPSYKAFIEVWIGYDAANQMVSTGQSHGEGWGSVDRARLEFTHANGKKSVIYMGVCGSSG